MSDLLLVLNAGSSSIKFQLFGAEHGTKLERLLKGQLDGIGVRPRLTIAQPAEGPSERALEADEGADLTAAFETVDRWLARALRGRTLAAIGHRIVHGGAQFAAPVLIDEAVLDQLAALIPLAPLHQPNNLAPVRAARQRYPETPQVACFDTAFHRGHPEVADRFAIPDELYRSGIRRYGFTASPTPMWRNG